MKKATGHLVKVCLKLSLAVVMLGESSCDRGTISRGLRGLEGLTFFIRRCTAPGMNTIPYPLARYGVEGVFGSVLVNVTS
jgi:hypothetical protein